MRWAGHVVHMGEGRNIYKFLVGRSKRKRPKRRWEDNIKTDLSWLRIGSNGEFFEHGFEPSGSIRKAGYCLTN